MPLTEEQHHAPATGRLALSAGNSLCRFTVLVRWGRDGNSRTTATDWQESDDFSICLLHSCRSCRNWRMLVVGNSATKSSSRAPGGGPLRSHLNARRGTSQTGRQLRSCPPRRSTVAPPLLRGDAYPPRSSAPTAVPRWRPRCTVARIGPVGRAASRSKGGGAGRRPATEDMSEAACPAGPIPRRHSRHVRSTAAQGRMPAHANSG